MKTKHLRLLPLLAAGLLSCQDQASNTTAPTEPGSVALTARLTTATGDSIPAVDSIRFKVKVAQKDTDLVVPWTAHKLELGTAKLGDSIHWQVTGWKWNAAKTQRSIVWTTAPHDTLVGVGGTKTTFTLATPISGQTYALPALTPTAFTVGAGDTVAVPNGTESFLFAFTYAMGDTGVCWINDTLQVGTAGSYSKNVTVAAGTSVPVKVVLKDALGAITIRTFTLTRPAATTTAKVDSGSTVSFDAPSNGQVLANSMDSVIVTVRTHSANKVDSVLLSGHRMTNLHDSIWLDTVRKLSVGDNELKATAYVFGKAGTVASVTVKRGPDSTSTATFATPATTTGRFEIGYDTSHLDVTVNTRTTDTAMRVEALLLNGKPMTTSDHSTWTYSVYGLPPAKDTVLTAIPMIGGKVGTQAVLTVRRRGLMPEVPTFSPVAGTYPTSRTVTLNCGTQNAVVQWSRDGKSWTEGKIVQVDTVQTVYVRAFGDGMDTSRASASYVIQAATPSFGLENGTYDSVLTVKVLAGATGTVLECSRDSSIWDACTAGSSLTVDVSDTLFVRASGPGLAKSPVARGAFVLQMPKPSLRDSSNAQASPRDTCGINHSIIATSVRIPAIFESRRDTHSTWQAVASRFVVRNSGTVFVRATRSGWLPSLPAQLYVKLDTSGEFHDSRDDSLYRWVRIGPQVWMAQNLNRWTDSSWCPNMGLASDCGFYGRLYKWATVMGLDKIFDTTSFAGGGGAVQGLCPPGWHVPTDLEWRRLIDTTLDSSTAGSALKTKMTSIWYSSADGLDPYGFAALPAGIRSTTGSLSGSADRAQFWSATESDAKHAYAQLFLSYRTDVSTFAPLKAVGQSLRCLLD